MEQPKLNTLTNLLRDHGEGVAEGHEVGRARATQLFHSIRLGEVLKTTSKPHTYERGVQ